jgi:hypothetical protein|tara:strand:- start:7258 stop:7506 length:249 start_codon:yes stop_codon:yes gene_type:complete
MSEDNQSSVRITNVQVYEKLLEVSNVQIEMVAELRGLKYLPQKVAEIDNRLAKVELIAKLVYGVYGAILGAMAVAFVGLINV